MTILDIIEKKREKQELSKEEIEFFINEYSQDKIADYQAAALVMAIFLNGMTKQETTNLTLSMANSGEVLDLSKLNKIIVDKHSTGGVGDKVSLILLPLVASLGIPVAKMSGRGLGFTGGTADKLEAIPGYKTNIDINTFIQNVENIGISMITQTLNLAPADKKLYALRDSIVCVESIPLIASSIMSKKIASGAQKIVLDVTVGKGAFMKTEEEAIELSKEMIEIGKLANRETICVLTNMDEPLGYAVGNNLEVIEAVEFLRGNMPEDLKEVVLELGAYMMLLSNKEDIEQDKGKELEDVNQDEAKRLEDIKQNKEKLIENIKNGKAYEKFLQLVENQDGDISYLENTEKFEKANFIESVYSTKEGYIQEIDAKEIGKLACSLGAGRIQKEDIIKPEVGIIVHKKVGEKVNEDEKIGTIFADSEQEMKKAKQKLLEIIKVSKERVEKNKTIIRIIN